MKKIILIIFFVFISFSAFSKEIELIVVETVESYVITDNDIIKSYLNVGTIVTIESELWKNNRSSILKVDYMNKKYTINRKYLINPNEVGAVNYLNVRIKNDIDVFTIEFHPFLGINNKELSNHIENGSVLYLFEKKYAKNETYQFVCSISGKYGWIDCKNIIYDNEYFYDKSISLNELNNTERHLLNETKSVKRNGPILLVPDNELIDSYSIKYRLFSIDEKFLIYCIVGNDMCYYVINGNQYPSTIILRGEPLFNNESSMLFSIDGRIMGNVVISIYDYKNMNQIKLIHQSKIVGKYHVENAFWDNNNIILQLNENGYTSFYELNNSNNWSIKSSDIKQIQFYD